MLDVGSKVRGMHEKKSMKGLGSLKKPCSSNICVLSLKGDPKKVLIVNDPF